MYRNLLYSKIQHKPYLAIYRIVFLSRGTLLAFRAFSVSKGSRKNGKVVNSMIASVLYT